MSAGEIAGLIAAVAFVLLVGALMLPLVKLGRLLDQSRAVVANVGEETVPLLREVTTTVREMTTTVTSANAQLAKVDTITTQVARVTTNVSGLTAVFAATLGNPAIKVAAFSYGVRRALSERNRAEAERALRQSRKSARRARRAGRGRRARAQGTTGGER